MHRTPNDNSPVLDGRQHAVGGGLVVVALASLMLVPYLPTTATHGTGLGFLEQINDPVVLAYAGFAGCGDTCPTRLAMLGGVYDKYSETGATDLALLFINVQRDTPDAVTTAYARAFHDRFTGYSVSSDRADEVYRELALLTFDDSGRAARHSDYVYIFTYTDQEWRIHKVYRRVPGADRLLHDLQRLRGAA